MSYRKPVTIVEQNAHTLEILPQKVYRYLGLGLTKPDTQLEALVSSSIDEFRRVARFRACFRIVPCQAGEEGTDLDILFSPGKSLAKNLSGCDQAILFAATAGLETERQRKRKEVTSSATALVLDAVGTAAIESFCDLLCSTWRNEFTGRFIRPRFSPGYGDSPLEIQGPLLESLDAKQLIGVTLTNAHLMLPQKSVSAIVGIGKTGCVHPEQDCQVCNKTKCEFRLA